MWVIGDLGPSVLDNLSRTRLLIHFDDGEVAVRRRDAFSPLKGPCLWEVAYNARGNAVEEGFMNEIIWLTADEMLVKNEETAASASDGLEPLTIAATHVVGSRPLPTCVHSRVGSFGAFAFSSSGNGLEPHSWRERKA